MFFSLSAFAPENLVSRDGFGSPVPRQPAHLHTQAESGAYLRDSSRVPRRRPFIYLKPPYAIGSPPSFSGHAVAYRWRSLPRVRRHRASKPLGSSERVLPWQVTMDQIICPSLSQTHYRYEVGMLKVPAYRRTIERRAFCRGHCSIKAKGRKQNKTNRSKRNARARQAKNARGITSLFNNTVAAYCLLFTKVIFAPSPPIGLTPADILSMVGVSENDNGNKI